jgi:hypothetical protein
MSEAKNSLRKISLSNLVKLRDFYKVNWPQHVVTFNFIDSAISNFEKYPEEVKIYTLNGVIDYDATFIGVTVVSFSLNSSFNASLHQLESLQT